MATTFGRPTSRLEIDWADPVADFVGEDETDYFISAQINRGRSTELDQMQAGSATIKLINRDGRFDPGNASGAKYPNVLPLRRVRLSAEIASGAEAFTARMSHVRGPDVMRGGTLSFPLFTGFITSWEQTWAQSNGDALTVASAVDGFAVLNMDQFEYDPNPSPGPPFNPDEFSGERVTRVLDAVEWPSGDRSLDAGTVTILGSQDAVGATGNISVDENALTYLLNVADTEGGWFFIDTLGRARFIDAAHDPALNPFDIYGGGTDERPYIDITVPFDESRLWNYITVHAKNVSTMASAVVQDSLSQRRFRVRRKTFTVLEAFVDDLRITDSRAMAFLVRYRGARPRIPRLELTTDNLEGWRQILGHELIDKIRVRKRPAVADMIEQDLRIEGISIDIPGGTGWTVTWQLSDTFENLLTDQQASPEDVTTGWSAETNCTLTATNPSVVNGVGDALTMTAVGAGDMAARTTPDDQVLVEVGKRYIATAQFNKAAAPVRSVRVEINWRDSAGTSLSTDAGTAVSEEAGFITWTQASVEAVAPSSAAFATARVVVVAAAAAEVHRVDLITLSRTFGGAPAGVAGVFGAVGTEFGGGTFGELLGVSPGSGDSFDSGTFDSSTFGA